MTRASASGPIRPDPRADVEGYLARLGLERPARPDAEWLFAAHRAHMAKVPYENLEIQLGRPTTVHPAESIARIVRGRGGYCFHLNGAFGTLLAGLGYEVTRHLGQVYSHLDMSESAELTVSHQALVVRCEGMRYFVDCGLGDAPFEPLPLRTGQTTQGPFTYRLEPWPQRPDGWRFVHDPRALSFRSMVFAPEPVSVAAFAQPHHRLSTSPDSGFVQAAVVARRDEAATEVLRGLVFSRVDATGPAKRTVETRTEWYELLADVYGLSLPEVGEMARERLWARVAEAHENWLVHQEAAEAEPPAAP